MIASSFRLDICNDSEYPKVRILPSLSLRWQEPAEITITLNQVFYQLIVLH